MKKFILISILFVSVLFSFAQTQNATTDNGKKVILNSDGTWKYLKTKTDSIQTKSVPTAIEILHAIDKMTDKNYYIISNSLLFEIGSKKLKLKLQLDEKGKYQGVKIITDNVGNCNEHNKLIFLFEDGTKVTLNSWNDFNCKGYSYFDLYGKELPNLQKKVKNIMFENGRTFESITVEVPIDEQDFFIQSMNAINNKLFVPAHFEDDKIIKD